MSLRSRDQTQKFKFYKPYTEMYSEAKEKLLSKFSFLSQASFFTQLHLQNCTMSVFQTRAGSQLLVTSLHAPWITSLQLLD